MAKSPYFGTSFPMPLSVKAQSQILLTQQDSIFIKVRCMVPHDKMLKHLGDEKGIWIGTTQKGPKAKTAPATVCGERLSTTSLV